jgi:hypothetical protein
MLKNMRRQCSLTEQKVPHVERHPGTIIMSVIPCSTHRPQDSSWKWRQQLSFTIPAGLCHGRAPPGPERPHCQPQAAQHDTCSLITSPSLAAYFFFFQWGPSPTPRLSLSTLRQASQYLCHPSNQQSRDPACLQLVGKNGEVALSFLLFLFVHLLFFGVCIFYETTKTTTRCLRLLIPELLFFFNDIHLHPTFILDLPAIIGIAPPLK